LSACLPCQPACLVLIKQLMPTPSALVEVNFLPTNMP
jgi:hypothetical protein